MSGCVSREKANTFSRRQSCRGKSQKPRSLDRMGGGNEAHEAGRQSTSSGWQASHRAVTKVNAQVASKVESTGGRACIRRVKAV